MRLALALLAPAALGTLAVAATAAGAGADGPRYALSAGTSPASTGTARQPLPIGLRLATSTAAAAGERPATAKTFRFLVPGLRANPAGLPWCSAARIVQAGTDRVCRRGAGVGMGTLELVAGLTDDPGDTSIRCHLDLTLYAAGPRDLALYLRGATNAPQPCAFSVSTAVPVALSRSAAGTALTVTLPRALLHPMPDTDGGVAHLAASLPLRVTAVRRRQVAFLSSAGGCPRGRRTVRATVTPETGPAASASRASVCRQARSR